MVQLPEWGVCLISRRYQLEAHALAFVQMRIRLPSSSMEDFREVFYGPFGKPTPAQRPRMTLAFI